MKGEKNSVPNLEQRCPACAGLFTISPASRKKRVQCPHCREIVTLTEPAEINGAADSIEKRPAPAPPEWLARCDQLQARIEALEQQVEALMVSPRPHAALLPDLLSGFRDQPTPSEPAETHSPAPPTGDRPPREFPRVAVPPPEPEPEPAFMRNFQVPTPEIGLLVAAGDEAAQRAAQALSDLLAKTGWKVRAARQDVNLPPGDGGLTLAAAPTLPVQRVTSTLNALRTAGYAVTYQLDPTRGPGEATLIVGAGAGAI